MRISHVMIWVTFVHGALSSDVVSFVSRKVNEFGRMANSMLSKRVPTTREGTEAFLFIGFNPKRLLPNSSCIKSTELK